MYEYYFVYFVEVFFGGGFWVIVYLVYFGVFFFYFCFVVFVIIMYVGFDKLCWVNISIL